MTRLNPTLPLKAQLEPYREALESRSLTITQLAKDLHYSLSFVRRTLKDLGIKLPPSTRHNKRELVAARKAYRLYLAKTLSVEVAAERANCSERTIYRYRGKR